ncbi:MAG TPA: trypsin-like peptidase domain-containing protein [Rhodopila sp.]|nr:trypsin-like peptidase domain-containing protein [Rhodopila sp.]
MAAAPWQPLQAGDISGPHSDLIRSLLPTVVNISVSRPEKPQDTQTGMAAASGPSADPVIKSYVGSGFIIDPSGLIVTNYHVVENAVSINITFSDGSVLPGKTMSASRLADLALVKVEADHPLTAAHWGDSDRIAVGDQVFAAGNPFGIGLSVSAGIVSGLNRDIQNSPYDALIQTDATINHGNSGGPLFDMQGNVIGVNSAIISPTPGSAGLGFAIPSSTAKFVIERLRTYGWVRPAWIGVKLQQVTPEIAQGLGMKQARGSILAWVLPGSPAQKAGLQIGDVVERYNDYLPTDERALLRAIASTPVGDTMKLLVRRGGTEHTVAVLAAEWPRDQWDQRDAPVQAQKPKVVIPPDLGLALAAIPADHRSSMGLEQGLTGVLVSAVAPNSDPSRRGMANGDVILRVQDKPVATPADVQAGVDAARADKRDYVLMLVLPKVRDVPGPKWVALALGTSEG